MFTIHDHFTTFYEDHVRLDEQKQAELAAHRDQNLIKLLDGLQQLGYAKPLCVQDQGSYAMSTMVQYPYDDYDIDVAVVFSDADLPKNALKSRKRILQSVRQANSNEENNTQIQTNAISIWHTQGYYVDFAVHRSHGDSHSALIEHAGAEWTRRNPNAINQWFEDIAQTKSPKGAKVEDGQFRRIVQYLKLFSKSRKSWNLPGGLLISALVAECYQPDNYADDKALFETMSAIHTRIQTSTEIRNPADPKLSLTYKNKHHKKVKNFGMRLDAAVRWLTPLSNKNCTELIACKSWKKVFNHPYWHKAIGNLESSIQRG